MNKVILMGNLTRDPEIRYSQAEDPITIGKFPIAVNRRFKREGEDDVDFFNCTCFGKQAEFLEKYFHQGSRVCLVGRIQNNNYTNKNGEKVYSVQIKVDELEFAERKGQSGGNNQNQGSQNNFDNSGRLTDDDFMSIPEGIEDGLPFN